MMKHVVPRFFHGGLTVCSTVLHWISLHVQSMHSRPAHFAMGGTPMLQVRRGSGPRPLQLLSLSAGGGSVVADAFSLRPGATARRLDVHAGAPIRSLVTTGFRQIDLANDSVTVGCNIFEARNPPHAAPQEGAFRIGDRWVAG